MLAWDLTIRLALAGIALSLAWILGWVVLRICRRKTPFWWLVAGGALFLLSVFTFLANTVDVVSKLSSSGGEDASDGTPPPRTTHPADSGKRGAG